MKPHHYAALIFAIFLGYCLFKYTNKPVTNNSFEKEKISTFNFSIPPYQWDSNGTGKYTFPVYAIHVNNLDKDIFITYISLSDSCWMRLPINNYLLPHDAFEYVYLKDRAYIQYYGPYKPKIMLFFKLAIMYAD